MDLKFKRAKIACYISYITMSVTATLSPILFLSFRSLYGLSYSLLGLLVLINFFTQLAVDLILSFLSHKLDLCRVVKGMPVIAVAGLWFYALWPMLFPEAAYAGLVIGTVVFSASAGLSEVLLSPVIAAIPAEDPDRQMSRLHSVYAWGVIAVVVLSTLFLRVMGQVHWPWLTFFFSLIPLCASILFFGADIPSIETEDKGADEFSLLKRGGFWLCVFGIFLGGAAECTMSQWCSGYLEQGLGIPKVWGDVFGTALFALTLGIGRSLYGKIGKNVGKVMFLGGIGATVCYLTAVLSDFPILGLFACGFTGFCVAMLWPGSLIVVTERFPAGGVFVYAMMAAGGDLGASVGPQLVGIVTDAAMKNSYTLTLAQMMSLSPEQIGMKLGMLIGMIFPLISIPVYWILWKAKKR